MKAGRANTGDVASGVVLAGLGLYIVLEARRWEYLGADGPGPGFFPLWYGIAMIALAVLLVATRIASRATPSGPGPDRRAIGRALGMWAGLAASVALLKVLGFLLAFAAFTFLVMTVMYRRPIGPALALAVGCALAFQLVFPLALNVRLPTGMLGY